MSLKLLDYVGRLQRTLQDIGEFLQPDDINNYLFQATIVYSKDRPLVKLFEITGDGSSFDFSLPSDWVEGTSYVKGDIEYPVNDDSQDQHFLDPNDWSYISKLVSTVRTVYIRFKTFIPANGSKARFEYATQHTLSETTNTIQDGDSQAVLYKAAALCFWALAARFAQSSDSTIEADVIDYARKSEIYTELAKEKESMYNMLMGIGEEGKEAGPASAGIAVKDLDIEYPGGLGDYLTHPSNTR